MDPMPQGRLPGREGCQGGQGVPAGGLTLSGAPQPALKLNIRDTYHNTPMHPSATTPHLRKPSLIPWPFLTWTIATPPAITFSQRQRTETTPPPCLFPIYYRVRFITWPLNHHLSQPCKYTFSLSIPLPNPPTLQTLWPSSTKACRLFTSIALNGPLQIWAELPLCPFTECRWCWWWRASLLLCSV